MREISVTQPVSRGETNRPLTLRNPGRGRSLPTERHSSFVLHAPFRKHRIAGTDAVQNAPLSGEICTVDRNDGNIGNEGMQPFSGNPILVSAVRRDQDDFLRAAKVREAANRIGAFRLNDIWPLGGPANSVLRPVGRGKFDLAVLLNAAVRLWT